MLEVMKEHQNQAKQHNENGECLSLYAPIEINTSIFSNFPQSSIRT